MKEWKHSQMMKLLNLMVLVADVSLLEKYSASSASDLFANVVALVSLREQISVFL